MRSCDNIDFNSTFSDMTWAALPSTGWGEGEGDDSGETGPLFGSSSAGAGESVVAFTGKGWATEGSELWAAKPTGETGRGSP
jgi:hypothetical protein